MPDIKNLGLVVLPRPNHGKAAESKLYILENLKVDIFCIHPVALKKPIILAVAGTGYKWEATEVRIRLQMGGNR